MSNLYQIERVSIDAFRVHYPKNIESTLISNVNFYITKDPVDVMNKAAISPFFLIYVAI